LAQRLGGSAQHPPVAAMSARLRLPSMAGSRQKSPRRIAGEQFASASRQPKCALEPGVHLRQQPIGQLADPVFQRASVDGRELGDVDN
jgi:hypothetical protein